MAKKALLITPLIAIGLLAPLLYDSDNAPSDQHSPTSKFDSKKTPQTNDSLDFSAFGSSYNASPNSSSTSVAVKPNTLNLGPEQPKQHNHQPTTTSVNSMVLEQQPDNPQDTDSQPLPILNTPHIPKEVLDTLRDSLRNALDGNTEYAALLSIKAAEQLPENKAFAAQMYTMAGRYYEQLQFNETAIAQYRLALMLIANHPASYNSLRRLDPEFARQNPPLPKASNKAESRPTNQKTATP